MNYNIELLEKKINYTFNEKKLLQSAITHSSFRNEQKINKLNDYERLEFLGDSILEFLSSEFFYREYAKFSEGELTKIRASVVCENALAQVAKELELGKFLKLGRGEEKMGGRDRASIIADVVEAIIGAIYLDGGLEASKGFIETFILSNVEKKQLVHDSKTALQEKVQKTLKKDIVYKILEETGPEHEKIFKTAVLVGDKILGEGIGTSKKLAEQQAAYEALLKLK